MPLTVVILAAGQGKRMNSDLPKVLQPLAGQPLLQHVIRTAQSLTPANICVVYGYGGAEVQAALGHEDVDWVLQAEQLGTGHAVMQAMSLIPDEHCVLVLYGDVPLVGAACLRKLGDLAAAGALALLSVNLHEPGSYGRIVRDASGHVRAIVEHKEANPAQLGIREINTGLMAAPAGRLREWLLGLGRNNSQREYYLTDVVALAVQAKDRVEAVLAPDPSEVMGVNDKVQLAEVEGCYRKLCARTLMLAGATLADPARIDIRGDIQVGRDVYIDVNAVLVGKVHLGSRVRIGPNCLIQNARIGADTEVLANTVIENAVIGEHCRIGPFARIRPETLLHRGVHVGNFVEIKKSEFGPGSKANHLSYVGDARVGSDVNVGAGTITCNYDGANKWPTVIEDGAFIGSGSMLVAPVRIGAGATIGAGSTITAGAPDGKLTLTRSPQVTSDSWQRPRKLSAEEQAQVVRRNTERPGKTERSEE
ncbi:MAG TPA: bifunctional UDP-N-acetylglucosamine diphosphorylase/glucosamine-1-phosphate N-acetyltransferase GlmU [Steroidobacteraceae bacterium]|jgi:bifunctional UDP-N-acetylglucosamine pyrophosphorylase/glucosamine-1-phosphate N-acetyltransferase|nr:bifunctional UDP-N-acetylglucosamine diphosphorylase/glucosamine-1-phosphate N-acetyltransferase GlmU [Steroidobacteraceae bacterium]